MDFFKRILIVQTAFAGDVILVIPVARAAKELFPDAEIHFLVKPDTGVLLKNNPFIHKIWFYDKNGSEKGLRAFIRRVKSMRNVEFDLALIPHRSIRSAALVWCAGIPHRYGFDKSSGSVLFTNVVKYSRDVHEVERNLQLLRPLGWNGKVPRPELYPGTDESKEVDRFFNEAGLKSEDVFMALAPGSLWPTKRWLSHGFSEVAQKIWKKWGVYSILLGGREDTALVDEIIENGGEGVINAAGRFSLLASAEVIRRCRVILANDSAPLHLAAGVGTPAAAIFGPTVPEFGFAPFGERNSVIQKKLDCRPCSIHGGNKCPKKHFKCMTEISSEDVIRALEKYFVE